MDDIDVGALNFEVLDVLIDEANNVKGCKNKLSEAIRATSHLVRAVSVARAVGRCPFEARLIEVMGASDKAASTSLFPGKGKAVHQVLALAVPRLFADYIRVEDFAEAYNQVEAYVREALEELRTYRVPPVVEANSSFENAVLSSAKTMASKFVELMEDIAEKGLLDVGSARARAELNFFDYKLHIRGIADLVVEDPGARKAVVVEWKTSEGDEWETRKGKDSRRPGNDEIVQSYIYAVMEAHRLGYYDGRQAVLDCKVFPVIIRDKGRINPYSVSKCYRTADMAWDEKKRLDEIVLAATHLLLSVVNIRSVDEAWDQEKEFQLCGKVEGERRIVPYRRVPRQLLEKNYLLNPHRNTGYPCKDCRLKEACKFYLFSRLQADEVDKLTWRARYRVFGVRENALQPYREFATVGVAEGYKFQGGSRGDLFERLELKEGLMAEVWRKVREDDERRGLPLTVREGKPVTIFLLDAEEPIYSVNFTGNVQYVGRWSDEVVVRVSFEGKFNKLSYFLLREVVSGEDFSGRIYLVEGNVDLTQVELMAIDAFQRATKMVAEENGLKGGDLEEAKRVAFRSGYMVLRKLYELFSSGYVVR